MAEQKKFNRPSWDWAGMEPDKPVTFTIVFDRNEKDDGETRDGETGEPRSWHKMVCKVNGADHTVFSQTDQMYDDWMTLDLNHKGQEFTVTKKAVWNKDTKKFKTTYEIQAGGTVIGKPKTNEPLKPGSVQTKFEPIEPPDYNEPLSPKNGESKSFEDIFLGTVNPVLTFLQEDIKDEDSRSITADQRTQLRIKAVELSTTMVNTRWMALHPKK